MLSPTTGTSSLEVYTKGIESKELSAQSLNCSPASETSDCTPSPSPTPLSALSSHWTEVNPSGDSSDDQSPQDSDPKLSFDPSCNNNEETSSVEDEYENLNVGVFQNSNSESDNSLLEEMFGGSYPKVENETRNDAEPVFNTDLSHQVHAVTKTGDDDESDDESGQISRQDFPSKLLARRQVLKKNFNRITAQLPVWFPGHSLLVRQLNIVGNRWTPSGAINLMIFCLTMLGLLTIWLLDSIGYGLMILVPVWLYTALWCLYPLVEPSDGSSRAVEIMVKHPYLYQAQLEGCDALYALSRDRSEGKRESIIGDGAVEAVLDAALHFENEPDLVARSMAILSRLLHDDDLISDLVQDDFIELVLLWMQEHILREAIQRHGMVLLATLVTVPSSHEVKNMVCQRALQANTIEVVCQSLDAHIKVNRVQQWGCMLLTNITDEHSGGAEPLHKGKVVQQVVKTLENHATAEPIQQIGVGLLAKCLTNNPQNPQWVQRINLLKDSCPKVFKVVNHARTNFASSPNIKSFTDRIMRDAEAATQARA